MRAFNLLGARCGRRGHAIGDLLGEPDGRQLGRGRHDGLEERDIPIRQRLDQSLDEDLGGLLRRDLLPARDLTLRHRRDTSAAGIEPSGFVHAHVSVQVVIPIDFEAVLVIAPLIHLAVAVVVHESAQQFPLPVAQRIADAAILDDDRLHLACVDRRRVGRRVVIDTRERRAELEQGCRGRQFTRLGHRRDRRHDQKPTENGHAAPKTPHGCLLSHLPDIGSQITSNRIPSAGRDPLVILTRKHRRSLSNRQHPARPYDEHDHLDRSHRQFRSSVSNRWPQKSIVLRRRHGDRGKADQTLARPRRLCKEWTKLGREARILAESRAY